MPANDKDPAASEARPQTLDGNGDREVLERAGNGDRTVSRRSGNGDRGIIGRAGNGDRGNGDRG